MAYDVSDGIEKSKIDTPSFFNLEECHAIVKIIKSLLSSPNVHIHAGQIAVITCFRAQVLKLRNILRAEGLPSINVGVVEDFQGQETSVVLISTVLTKDQERWKSGAKSGLGFMTDPKKFNVAITRASALCIIVGKIAFLENSGSYWSALMEHIRKNGGMSGDSGHANDDEYNNDLVDYGIEELMSRIESMKLLGAGYEMDRYMLAMRGYYEDSPEWRVCL
jgi:Superfamily I DNA and RNA helicases and helicase subunits